MTTFHGKPCRKAGHTLRYVNSGHCVECLKEKSKIRRQTNPEAVAIYNKRWRTKYPERHKENYTRWRKTPEGKGKRNALTSKYRAAKLQATPSWITEAQLAAIQLFYIKCPEGYEVDHIIPLQGKFVSGLHVPWNLQYLKQHDNRKKYNFLIAQ